LKQAKTVKDMLAIEKQMATLREDIESAEGQIKRFDNQITLSSLEVTFFEETERASIPFAKYFRNGVSNGWKNLIWLFVGLINIWPFILMIALLGLTIRFRRSR
jgi:hypothetical protein